FPYTTLFRSLAELDLVDAGLVDVAADRHETCARGFISTELGVRGPSVVDDPWHGHERLDVVEQRRPAPGALDGGEGRTGSRLGALAFERLEQRGLLAADIGAVAAVQTDVERVVLAHRFRTDVAFAARLFACGTGHPVRLAVFTPYVHT